MTRILIRIALLTCLLVLGLSKGGYAADCVLNSTFPNLACPFSEQERKSVKFSDVSFGLIIQNQELAIRFNSVRYRVRVGASWFEEGDCDEEDIEDLDDLEDLRDEISDITNDSDPDNDFIAFTVNPDDVREITTIWFIACKVDSLER